MKNKRIHIFIEEEFLELAKEKAKEKGYLKLSPYIRDLIAFDILKPWK